MRFLRAGLDVYVCDSVERGRASWAPYPHVYRSEPFFRTAREAWEVTYRFGPAGVLGSGPSAAHHASGPAVPRRRGGSVHEAEHAAVGDER